MGLTVGALFYSLPCGFIPCRTADGSVVGGWRLIIGRWRLTFGPLLPVESAIAPAPQVGANPIASERRAMSANPTQPLESRFERLRRALDQHAIVSETDARGAIVEVNDKFCEISGYQRAELIGTNHRLVKSGLHPPEVYRQLWSTIARGEVWQGELCNRRRDGGLYWVEATIVPFLGPDGRPERYVSIRTDITALKESETMALAAKAAAEAGIRAKTAFLERMSHELHTPLNAILGFGQLLEADVTLDAEQRDSVVEVVRAARHLASLIDQLLAADGPAALDNIGQPLVGGSHG